MRTASAILTFAKTAYSEQRSPPLIKVPNVDSRIKSLGGKSGGKTAALRKQRRIVSRGDARVGKLVADSATKKTAGLVKECVSVRN
jgi:hypothetical protein